MKLIRFTSCLAGVLILIMMTGGPLLAQDTQGRQNLLPEIDPQDIEIRSEFRASFPGLRRQPILGFNPSPRVYQISPDRTPFLETQEQVVASLPIVDIARPESPNYNPMNYSDEINGAARLGIGSYSSPEADFWGVYELSDKSQIGGALHYRSADSHLETQSSSYRNFNARVKYATALKKDLQLSVNSKIESNFNYLINPSSFAFTGSRKNYQGFNIGSAVRSFKNSIEGWVAEADVSYYTVDIGSAIVADPEGQDLVFNASFNKRWAGERLHEIFTLKVGSRGGQYTPLGPVNMQWWNSTHAGLEYQRLFDFSTQLTADGSLYYTSNLVEDKIYPALDLELKHWLQDDLAVTGTLEGRPYHRSQREHHIRNRFFDGRSLLRHTYQVDARAEIVYNFLEGSSIESGLSYMTAWNYPYYQFSNVSDTLGNGHGFYTVGHMDANRIKGYFGVSHQLNREVLWISAQAYVQRSELENGARVPFEENWGVNSTVSFKPVDRLTVQGRAEYVGKRETAAGQELDGFLLLGTTVEVDITDRIGAYAKIENLLNQEYQVWRGYPERQLQAYGGIEIKLK